MNLSIEHKKCAFVEKRLQMLYNRCLPESNLAPPMARLDLHDEPGFAFSGMMLGVQTRETYLISRFISGIPETLEGDTEHCILRAIVRCRRKGDISISSFLAYLAEVLTELQCRDTAKWTCLYLTDIPTELIGKRLLGQAVTDLGVASRELILGRPRGNFDWLESPVSPEDLPHFRCIRIQVNAVGLHSAFDKSYEVYSCLRSALNVVHSAISKTIYSPHSEVPAQFSEPQIFAIRSGRIIHIQADREGTGVAKQAHPNSLQAAAHLLRNLRNEPKPKSSSLRLKRALLAFGSALDSPDFEEQFFGIWRALEILVNTTGGNTQQVCARCAHLLPDVTDALNILEAFTSVRNNLVHNAIFPREGRAPVHWLMDLAYGVLRQFSDLIREFPSDGHFDDYFALAPLGDADLIRKARVVRIVRQQRHG